MKILTKHFHRRYIVPAEWAKFQNVSIYALEEPLHDCIGTAMLGRIAVWTCERWQVSSDWAGTNFLKTCEFLFMTLLKIYPWMQSGNSVNVQRKYSLLVFYINLTMSDCSYGVSPPHGVIAVCP